MPRHRSRQFATHELTAEREGEVDCSGDGDCPEGSTCDDGTCVDDYGTPITRTQDVVEDEPVEYDSGGTSFVRGSTGERVSRTPTISGRGALVGILEEGDLVTLTPLPDAPVTDELDGLAVASIDGDYARRARVGTATIELESV